MISAIIVAGGKGKRMGQDISKQYIKLGDVEILAITLRVFEGVNDIDEVIVVAHRDEIDFCRANIVDKYGFKKVRKIVAGGEERQQSVYNGLKNCNEATEIVLIHDGARPFISSSEIKECIGSARKNGACTVAVPVKDTIKVADEQNEIVKTLRREELFSIQTPQGFKYALILEAHEKALENNIRATDDSMLVESLGVKVKIVRGSYFNIKLTTPEDLVFGGAILNYLKDMDEEK